MFRSSLRNFFLILCFLCPAAVFGSGPASPASASELRVYRFDPAHLSWVEPVDGMYSARIALVEDGEEIDALEVGFGIDEAFIVPLPASVARDTVQVEVTVGSVLLDVLSSRQVADLTREVWHESPATMRGLRQELATSRPASGLETAKPLKLFEKSCSSCDSEYIQCVMGCQTQACQAACDNDYSQCLLSCPSLDADHDGVPNGSDNCIEVANSNQANCDGDAYGDACDHLNAIYQNVGSEKTCEIDRDQHFFDYDLEHYVGRRQVDVSSCNAPDRWNRRIAKKVSCSYGVSEETCCDYKLSGSILSFGDDPLFWCRIWINDCQ